MALAGLLAGLLLAVTAAAGTAQAQAGPDRESAIGEARLAVAAALASAADRVVPLRVEPVTWRDGCLGLAEADELCSQALVDGWAIWLAVDDLAYRAHSNGDGSVLRLAAEAVAAAAVGQAPLPAGALPRPQQLPATGNGALAPEADDDGPPGWVWGVIGAVAGGAVLVGLGCSLWGSRRGRAQGGPQRGGGGGGGRFKG